MRRSRPGGRLSFTARKVQRGSSTGTCSDVSKGKPLDAPRYSPPGQAPYVIERTALTQRCGTACALGRVPARLVRAREAKEETDSVGRCPTNRTGSQNMKRFVRRLKNDECGQDLIEYALLAAFISLVAIAAITNVGSALNGVWGGVDTQMAAAASAAS